MARTDTRSLFDTLIQQWRGAPTRWLCFAALLAWIFGLYWSDLFASQMATQEFDFLELRALWLGAEAVTLIGVYVIVEAIIARERTASIIAGTMLFAGTVVILFVPGDDGSAPTKLVGVVLTSLGSALLLVVLGIGFARKGPKALLVNVALALLIASACDTVLLYLPHAVQPMLVSLLPIACSGCIVLGKTEWSAKPVTARTVDDPSSKTAGIIRAIVLPLIVGVAYGLMQRLTGDVYTSGAAEVNGATVISIFLSAVLIGLAALIFDSRKLIKLVCFAAIPTIGIAFVILPIFSDAFEAVQAICIIGFNSFYFMVWALWSGDPGKAGLPRRFVLGLCVLVASESLGSIVGSRIVTVVNETGATLAVVSVIVVYLLLMAAILSFDRSNRTMMEEAGRVAAGDAASPIPRTSDEDLDEWVLRYHLSARETDVFKLLAKGRNRVYISKELFISDNTTRTHMKSIYRKLDIHSHQELIDLLEGK
ncbi:MAG: helix-turn-helix transcriptional regulator [Bifidobacteriaceae bacterium]|jgi:DNA-binding CsgD family transcriptional regulator|nr:helix-turn-helix transcriptional regulator [Bifidobacteriaceae bacterium]